MTPGLFPISLVGVESKRVVDRHSRHLARTVPSKIELECTRAGIDAVLKLAEKKANILLERAVASRRMADVDAAELYEFAAENLTTFIAEVKSVL